MKEVRNVLFVRGREPETPVPGAAALRRDSVAAHADATAGTGRHIGFEKKEIYSKSTKNRNLF